MALIGLYIVIRDFIRSQRQERRDRRSYRLCELPPERKRRTRAGGLPADLTVRG